MSKYRKYIIIIWFIVISGLLSIFTLFFCIKIDAFGLFGGLPSYRSLERPESSLSSQLYFSDGGTIGNGYYRQNRSAVEYSDLSQELITTLLSTEDRRYVSHSGIDLKGILSALKDSFLGYRRGASTITIQLAENLYSTSTENQGSLYKYRLLGQIITKLKEWIIAIQLETNYTKEEIIAMYLNTIEYGSNSYGIKVAAQTFFNKLPSELNYKESAVIVGLINKPTAFNPVLNPERAMRKRTEVLYNLYKYEKIDSIAFDSLSVSDFGLEYKVANQNQGPATYFRSVIKNDLMRWCDKNGYDLWADGLKIYTTIDSRLQNYAEMAMQEQMDTLQQIFIDHLNGDAPWIDRDGNEILDFVDQAIARTPEYRRLTKKYGKESDSLNYYLNVPKKMRVFSWGGEIDTTFSLVDSLKYYKHFLQAGFMAMDPHTGHIKAWVGGIDHKYFKFDHVRQSRRQPGSTFKPFVYTAAIDAGYSPCFSAVDAPIAWKYDPSEEPWVPQNANGVYTGEKMTIRRAMASSVNTITARVMQEISPRTVVDMAHTIGIESDLAAVPSLCLGAGGEVSLFEMIGAYSTFVNQGVWTKPFYITRIEDKNGVVLQDFVPQRREALSEKTAYLMIHMLKGATEEVGGSARALDYELLKDNELGAKTGTTQNASDGWYMGVTEDLVAGAWVGGDERSIHFKHWALGQGARTARPIWQNFMLKVYNDPLTGITKKPFRRPTVPLGVELDCDIYGQQSPLDSDTVDLDFHGMDDQGLLDL